MVLVELVVVEPLPPLAQLLGVGGVFLEGERLAVHSVGEARLLLVQRLVEHPQVFPRVGEFHAAAQRVARGGRPEPLQFRLQEVEVAGGEGGGGWGWGAVQ